MSLTLSTVILPTFTKALSTLSHILTAAAEHAKAHNLDADAEYPAARLAPDMLPLTFQVQNATTTVRRTLARIEGREDVPWADDEKTIDDLLARVAKTKALLEGYDGAVVDGRAGETIVIPFGPRSLELTGVTLALNQAVPNIFFHLTTAYAILRSKGVPLGKKDYIGSFLGF